MKPDEIIRRLELVRNAYIANVSDLLPEEEVSANVEAVDAAISTQKEMMELTVRAQKDEVIAERIETSIYKYKINAPTEGRK